MSRENVEIAKAAYGAPEGLIAAIRGRVAPDVVFDFSDIYPDRPVLRGVEAVREFRVKGPWADLAFEADEFFEVADDTVLVLVRMTALGASSGVSVEQTAAHELRFADGQLVHFKVHPDQAAARAALGLRE